MTTTNTTTTRKSYRFTNDASAHAQLTFDGVRAYHSATLAAFARTFDGTDYEVAAINAQTKPSKRGTRYEIIIVPRNLASKGIHITMNTTASIDYRKVAAAYVKKWSALKVKADDAAKPENVAARAESKRKADAMRKARNYRNYLERHGMTPADAEIESGRYLAQLIAA